MAKKSDKKALVRKCPTVEKTKEVLKDEVEEKKDVKTKELIQISPEDLSKKLQTIKDQSCAALAAMRKYLSETGGKSLFPDIDHALNLVFTYKKPATVSTQSRHKIKLPHSHRTIANTSVCLILPDFDHSDAAKVDPDVDKQAREWEEKLEKDHGITSKHVAKIMTKIQLEREAHTYHDRRALASRYDFFLVDAQVEKSVCAFTGKEFGRVHKRPILFKYSKPLATTIEETIQTVFLPLGRYMTRACINVGHLGQESSDLLANIATVLEETVKVCPGGLPNIRGIFLQPSNSKPSLPIYSDDGATSDIKLPTEKRTSRASLKSVVDECNTLPDGLKIQVRRNGKIRVLKEEDGKAVIYPTIHDEWDEKDMRNTKPTINPAKLAKNKKRREKSHAKRVAQLVDSGISPKKTKN